MATKWSPYPTTSGIVLYLNPVATKWSPYPTTSGIVLYCPFSSFLHFFTLCGLMQRTVIRDFYYFLYYQFFNYWRGTSSSLIPFRFSFWRSFYTRSFYTRVFYTRVFWHFIYYLHTFLWDFWHAFIFVSDHKRYCSRIVFYLNLNLNLVATKWSPCPTTSGIVAELFFILFLIT